MKRLWKFLAILIGLFLLTSASFGVGLAAGSNNLFTPCIVRTGEQPAQFAIFWQAWNLVQKNFVDRSALDPVQLTYGAIRGMVNALGDTGHSNFLTPKERELQASSLSGSFSGIGAQMGIRDGLPIIVAPIDGSPAAKAGIKAGDILIRVDGEDVTTTDLSAIVEKVRGPAGSTIQLTILRPSDRKTYDFTITRSEIDVPAASWAMVPGTKVAMIRLSQFSENAERDVTNALQAAQQAGATGLIFDVRNDPGGLLDQAIKVTSQFLKDGNVLLEEDAQGNRNAFAVQPPEHPNEMPLVVLVNPGTASSAEIFAGAIQDHQRGKVVGETTFGTGTVLQPFILDDDSALLLGVKQWLTPDGRVIRNHGIQPDEVVTMPLGADLLTPPDLESMSPEDVRASADAQVQKALELLDASPAATPTSSN